MLDIIASQLSFIALVAFFIVTAIGAVLLRRNDSLANAWSGVLAIIGSAWGILFSLTSMILGKNMSFAIEPSSFPLLSISFHIDTLSAFFIFVISLIALFCSFYSLGYVKHYFGKYNIGALGFFYNLFIAGMFLVVTASNGLFFLIAWEIMSLASYFLVIYDKNDEENVKAGFLYLVMTHVGTAFIILALILCYKYTGSFDFDAIKAGALMIPLMAKNLIFVFALIGFGTKAGIIPFHIWLPAAHPAAPSHVSALMSGVMIKTGIYMLIRLFLDLLSPLPTWWGPVILVIASISSLLGVLYALTEHDIKRLLAYHSIENIGIILFGVGSAVTFLSLGLPSLALLGLVAALFHTLNHATFKSLLFLGAGSVINETHTRNMEEYGGLIKYMPQTAFFFLIGAMAISALPPFNGFFSEWLTFQALFQGIATLGVFTKWTFIIAAGSLAFTGGLALACFVKAFGAIFLARPRSEEVSHAKESAFLLRFGMGGLALLSLVFGVFSGYLTSLLERIGSNFGFFQEAGSLSAISTGQGLAVGDGFSSVSAPVLFLIMSIALLAIAYVIRSLIYKKQTVVVGETWDCGVDLKPRMEITATGFARSIILIFRGILKPSIQKAAEYDDSRSRFLPTVRTVTLGTRDVYQAYFYQPISRFVTAISVKAKSIQGGNTNAYILYIFIALVIALYSIL